jgi:signal transduction histidine kinase
MTPPTVAAAPRGVVGRHGEPGAVPEVGAARLLVREEERRLVSAEEERAEVERYLGRVSGSPYADARWAGPFARDAAPAVALAAVGLLEVLAGPGGDGSRAVSAVAVVGATLPLAWRRVAPLLPLAAILVALIVQALLGGFLIGQAVTPLVALAIALYWAGRHVESRGGLAAAALGVVVASATRVVADPGVHTAVHAALTLAATSMPLLVGRWVRGQALLRRRLVQRAQRLARDRERDARDAAEEERMRIAGDLQAAIAGRLQAIVSAAGTLPGALRAGYHGAAHALFSETAATARDALGDVRRVLGILRRDGQQPRLTPPAADPLVGVGDGAMAPSAAPGGARQPEPRRRRPSAPAFGARALDLLLAGAVLAGVELELALAASPGDRVAAALTAAPIAAPLLWRRRHPLRAGAAVLGGVALQSALVDLSAFPVSDIAAVVCATYAIGAYAERRAAVAGLVLAGAGAAVHAAIFYPDGVVAALLGGVAAPWTLGRVIRGHRQLTHQGREEAARAERAREREARAAVVAERMRVARELHDVVAHNISVIAIQAAGADGVVERDPDRAVECAALIATVAREALAELDRLVGAFDADASGHGAAPPSLEHVGALAARARRAGQPVDVRVEGEPAALPGGVDFAAYRIVQEALTNASKHAGGARAQVVVRYERHAVEVEIADDGRAVSRPAAPPGRTAAGTGHGLIGIRERVALYGGTLEAGRRPSGGFRVHARLPVPGP